MLRSLMTHFDQDPSILRFLNPKMQQEVEALGMPHKLNFPSMLSVTKWLQRVHYSWFYPYLSTLPKKSQLLFFPLFSTPQRKGLESMLKLESKPQEMAPFLSYFLADHLRNQVQKEEVIPIDALPQSSLNPLIHVQWSKMMQIIDILGLFDLACDSRQIVDKSLIDKIHKALPKEYSHFLNYAIKQPIKWTSPRMNLEHWNGDREKLMTLLHQRGLMRLAKGILKEHLSLRWHLIHRLDVGRAKVMINALSLPVDAQLIPYFKSQVLTTANRVCS